MAKTSQVARNKKRMRAVQQHAPRRKELKAIIRNPHSAPEEVAEACAALSGLPRDASPTRVVSRCELTGRARAVYRKFGVCRNEFRRLAHSGQLPGVRKASW